jgi:hypothetical protein
MRILSLDGGGTWALLQVQALIDLFPQARTGRDVLRQFDYAAANSGGTLVLAGLIEDLPLVALHDLFLDQAARQAIFARLPFWRRVLRIFGFGPQYEASQKIDGIARYAPQTGQRPINELGAVVSASTGRPFQFLMMSFDYDRRRAVFQRSDAGSAAASNTAPSVPTLAQAVHAATNAPVNYFDAPATFPLWDGDIGSARPRRFWDGAIGGYNNPALAALVEVLARPNRPALADITMLSIGTANVALPMATQYPGAHPLLVERYASQSLIHDVGQIATAVLDDPPDAASFIAHVWLGGALPGGGVAVVENGPVVRLNPLVQPLRSSSGTLSLPGGIDAATFQRLRDLPMDAVENEDVALIRSFGAKWLAGQIANQPVRANSYSLMPEIGFARYPAARTAWLARNPWR